MNSTTKSISSHRKPNTTVVITVLMTVVALACVAIWARNIPLAEDWHMVPALTGNESNMWSWLWSQNNEHRLPIQRAMYLILLQITEDFRSGMVVNIALLLIITLATARVAAKLRGHPALQDAIFPFALLHLGHWENMIWGWQIQFVWSVFLTVTMLCIIVWQAKALSSKYLVIASIVLPLLALSGGNGLMMSFGLLPWLACQSFAHAGNSWISPREASMIPARLTSRIAAFGCIATLLAIGAYFIGYVRPPWSPPLATPTEFLLGAQGYFAYGFGPGSRGWLLPFAVSTLLIAVLALVLALKKVIRGPASERLRAIGLVCFIGTTLAIGLIIVAGRGTYAERMPDRYALLSVITIIAAVYSVLLYAPKVISRKGLALLAVMYFLMIPANTYTGLLWRDWYVGGMTQVEQDVNEKISLVKIAENHKLFLMHWGDERLLEGMLMLQEKNIGPFGDSED